MFRYYGPKFVPIFLSVFIVLWSLVWRVSADEGRVMTPCGDLNFDDAVSVWYDCCYVWSEVWCDYHSYSRAFCFAGAEIEGVLVDTICGGIIEVCFCDE